MGFFPVFSSLIKKVTFYRSIYLFNDFSPVSTGRSISVIMYYVRKTELNAINAARNKRTSRARLSRTFGTSLNGRDAVCNFRSNSFRRPIFETVARGARGITWLALFRRVGRRTGACWLCSTPVPFLVNDTTRSESIETVGPVYRPGKASFDRVRAEWAHVFACLDCAPRRDVHLDRRRRTMRHLTADRFHGTIRYEPKITKISVRCHPQREPNVAQT